MSTRKPDHQTRRPPIRPWRWWRRFTTGARARILISIVLLLAFSTIVSTLALRQILLARVDTRIEAGLAQEVAEFRSFATTAKDPKTGRRVKDIQRIFDLFLARDIPDQGQATFTFIAGRPYRSNADIGTSRELLTHVRSLGNVTGVSRGDVAIPDGHIRYLSVPVAADGLGRGTFVVTSNLGHERSEVDEAVRISAGIGLAMLLLVSVLAYLATGRVLAPLRELEGTARTISSGDDLTRRIEVHGRDEIADLGRTFNAMLDRLEEAFRIQRDFVSDAGHELRTPITIIRGHLELLDDDPVEREKTVAVVTDELDRMSRFVEDLLTLARAERPDFLHLGEIDLDLLTEELLVKATQLANRDWQLEATGVGLIAADRQRLTQAVMNLAHNAVQHTTEGDRIGLGSALDSGSARVWIADSGPGIAEEDAARVFERFARAENTARRSDGAGLGLAIVRTIAEAHGGRVELESEPGKGARFTIVIPVDAPAPGLPFIHDQTDLAAPHPDPERITS
ncbi:MAG: HAMP domain-containing histidine kinase [Solirubrobacterales bacterium]|nr:HAMP domain-containing histidine kinase [Solirubrobacterales bacterium]